MRVLVYVFLCCFLLSTRGTSIVERSLPDLVASSDHTIVARITAVDWSIGRGIIRDPLARTGPFNPYTIRFHLELTKGGRLKTNTTAVREKLIVNSWSGWINSLEQFKPWVGQTTFSS
jgi:hypothetical protein